MKAPAMISASMCEENPEDAAILIASLEVEVEQLHEALAQARAWHESEDKALSKSGRRDAEYHWRRDRHREQIDAIKAVQPNDEYDRVWDAINARAPNDEDDR